MKLPEHIQSVYRVIPQFMRSMTKQMMKNKNLAKPHWSRASNSSLMDRLTSKAHCLEENPMSPKTARLVCVDIANFAMLIHDNIKNSRG